MPRLKLMFGFSLLVILGILAAIIGLGRVTQEHSFGLDIVLGALATLAGAFSNWAFSSDRESLPRPSLPSTPPPVEKPPEP